MKFKIGIYLLFWCGLALGQVNKLVVESSIISSGNCPSEEKIARDEVRFKPSATNSNIRITPCDATKNNSVRLKTDFRIISPMNITGGSYDSQNGYSTPIPATTPYVVDENLPVGYTGGSGSVSPNGAASYTIPIQISPGTAGIQPSISIVYNSNAGNGTLGYGWELSGLSVISRTTTNLYHDNKLNDIKLNNNDKLVLDGERLFSSSETYWGENEIYKTESENYKTITQKGNGSQIWFEVKSSDGSVAEYGRSDDSKHFVGVSILAWKLNKVTDVNGNYINYKYNNGQAISEIEYKGNINNGQLPYNKILFKYATKPDFKISYINGASTTENLLLLNIEIYSNSDFVRKYKLDYIQDVYSKLHKVSETDVNGAFLNPTIINWDGNHTNVANIANNTIEYLDLDTRYNYLPTLFENKLSGDFNGDGKSDIVEVFRGKWTMYLSQDNTTDFFQVNYNSIQIRGNRNYDVGTNTAKGKQHLGFFVADLDNDGKDELIENYVIDLLGPQLDMDNYLVSHTFDPTNQTISRSFLYSSSGRNNLLTQDLFVYLEGSLVKGTMAEFHQLYDYSRFYTGDFNGDKKSDYIIFDKAFKIKAKSPNLDLSINLSPFDANLNSCNVLDIEGDGRSDFLVSYSTYSKVYKFDATTKALISSNVNHLIDASEMDEVIPGDFNGDNKTDLLIYKPALKIFKLFHSNGSEFVDPISLSFKDYGTGTKSINEGVQIGDFNGDGVIDISYLSIGSEDKISFWFRKGNTYSLSIERLITNGSVKPFKKFIEVADFNGDGTSDFFIWGSSSSKRKIRILRTFYNVSPLQVQKITNGFGNSIGFKYAAIADNSIYNPNFSYGGSTVRMETAQAIKRRQDFKFPMKLVKYMFLNDAASSSFDNGTPVASTIDPKFDGLENITQYNYEGGYIHKEGRGFLGFHSFVSFNLKTKVKEYIYSRFNTTFHVPYVFETKSNVIVPNSPILNVGSYNYVPTFEAVSEGSKRYFTYISRSTSTDYIKNITKVEDIVIDKATGNQTLQRITHGTKAVYLKENTYATSQNGLQRLTKEVETTTYATQTPYIREVEYVYDNLGRIKLTKTDPTLPLFLEVEIKARDAFGNPTSVESRGGEILPDYYQTKRTEYDQQGRFVIKTYDELNRTSTATFDGRYGVPLEMKGINGLTIRMEYDNMGRKIRDISPDGSITNYARAFVANNDVADAMYYISTSSIASPTQISYFDKYERNIYNSTDGINGTVISWNEYNDKGKIYKSSIPKYTSEPLTGFTEYFYDNFGRSSSIIERGRTTSFAYNGKTTSTTTPDNKITSQTIDDLGNVISSKDAINTETTYNYNSQGNVTNILHDNVPVSFEYDSYGRKTASLEIGGVGRVSYEYDAFGKLKSQTDAKGKTTFIYDKSGNLTSKTTPDLTTTYSSQTSGAAVDQIYEITLSNGNKESYTYDNLGRASSKTEIINGQTFVNSFTFNALGQVQDITYPSGFKQKNVYNTHGFLTSILKETNTETVPVWTLNAANAMGQLTRATLGNGLVETREYDNFNMPTIKNVGLSIGYEVSFNQYTGNVNYRRDTKRSITESFTYDALNRLETASVGNQTTTYAYDKRSNFTTKSDVATAFNYRDNAVFKDVLASIVEPIINPLQRRAIPLIDQTTIYNASNRIMFINEGSNTATFMYGADDNRRFMTLQTNAQNTQTYYVGNYEKEITNTTNTTERTYIFSPYGLVAMQLKTSTPIEQTDQILYTTTDHLGSVIALTAQSGAVVKFYNFDAYGRRRSPYTWQLPTTDAEEQELTQGNYLTRGFTFHEHLDAFGLINMNARLYDPALGRFLSPDPILHVGYSPYHYAAGNPLRYTDPSGMFFLDDFWGQLWGTAETAAAPVEKFIAKNAHAILTVATIVVSVVVTVATLGAASPILVAVIAGVAIGAASGAGHAIIDGKSFGEVVGAALLGGVVGGATALAGGAVGAGVGGLFKEGANLLVKYGVTGFTAGAASGFVGGFGGGLAAGQNFGEALLSGLTGAAIGGAVGGAMGVIGGGIKQGKINTAKKMEILRKNAEFKKAFENATADVTNKTKKTIYYKPENTGEALEIPSGATLDVEIDGIKVNGQVTKVSNGYNDVIVNPNGSIETNYSNPFKWIWNKFNGGPINVSPDGGWDNLFNVK